MAQAGQTSWKLIYISRDVGEALDRAWFLAKAGGSKLSKLDFASALIQNSLDTGYGGSCDESEAPAP